MTVPLITLEDVKGLLPIRDGNTDFDAQIESHIATASMTIERACRQSFARAERSELYSSRATSEVRYDLYGADSDGLGDGLAYRSREQTLMLRAEPIDVSEDVIVRYDTRRQFGDDTIIAAENYFVDVERNAILLRYPTRAALSAIQVTYTAGYAEADGTLSASIPDDLKRAAIMQTIYLFNRSLPEQLGATTIEQGDETKTLDDSGISREVRPLLRPYKRVLTGRL